MTDSDITTLLALTDSLRAECNAHANRVGLSASDLANWRLVCPPGRVIELLDERARLVQALREARGERDAAFDRGRTAGREDVGKYSHAIGQIEAVLGIAGAQPMSETVEAVRTLKADRDAALREADRELERYKALLTEALDIAAECALGGQPQPEHAERIDAIRVVSDYRPYKCEICPQCGPAAAYCGRCGKGSVL